MTILNNIMGKDINRNKFYEIMEQLELVAVGCNDYEQISKNEIYTEYVYENPRNNIVLNIGIIDYKDNKDIINISNIYED